eukprot:TRINITY_DN93941_c0_g1_i1.p1 TRINITY_DN93941_c0_g1~~TRINITY_DN93941_c0_g1_i1.p1  ORF type:complete len:125 (-),score=26.06 TRINITY_DN93941_c0_g1_i1:194-568(-)
MPSTEFLCEIPDLSHEDLVTIAKMNCGEVSQAVRVFTGATPCFGIADCNSSTGYQVEWNRKAKRALKLCDMLPLRTPIQEDTNLLNDIHHFRPALGASPPHWQQQVFDRKVEDGCGNNKQKSFQ